MAKACSWPFHERKKNFSREVSTAATTFCKHYYKSLVLRTIKTIRRLLLFMNFA